MKSRSWITTEGRDYGAKEALGNSSWRNAARGVYQADETHSEQAGKSNRCPSAPAPRINDIVLEKRSISADTAIRLARFFGNSPEFWMNLQASYDLRKAKAELGKRLNNIKPFAAQSAA